MRVPVNLDERYAHEVNFPMTVEDFLQWEAANIHAEWVGGQVTVFMPGMPIYQTARGFLLTLLSSYVSLFDLGRVLSLPFSMRARDGGSVREPDLLFIAREHDTGLESFIWTVPPIWLLKLSHRPALRVTA